MLLYNLRILSDTFVDGLHLLTICVLATLVCIKRSKRLFGLIKDIGIKHGSRIWLELFLAKAYSLE